MKTFGAVSSGFVAALCFVASVLLVRHGGGISVVCACVLVAFAVDFGWIACEIATGSRVYRYTKEKF